MARLEKRWNLVSLDNLVNDVKSEHLTPIMSTDVKVPGQTAPHLASSIDTLYIVRH